MPELNAHSSPDAILDEALEESFPSSDPISVSHAYEKAVEQEASESETHPEQTKAEKTSSDREQDKAKGHTHREQPITR